MTASWLQIPRTVRFGDTDAAGVMHFHQLLRWCHEAWEESLQRFGIPAAQVFPGTGPAAPSPATEVPTVAVPLVHCSADFRRPLHCGDGLLIRLSPRTIGGGFEVAYELWRSDGPLGGEIVAPARCRRFGRCLPLLLMACGPTARAYAALYGELPSPTRRRRLEAIETE